MDKEDGVYVYMYIYTYVYIYIEYILTIFHIWNITQPKKGQNWVIYSEVDKLRICHTE